MGFSDPGQGKWAAEIWFCFFFFSFLWVWAASPATLLKKLKKKKKQEEVNAAVRKLVLGASGLWGDTGLLQNRAVASTPGGLPPKGGDGAGRRLPAKSWSLHLLHCKCLGFGVTSTPPRPFFLHDCLWAAPDETKFK